LLVVRSAHKITLRSGVCSGVSVRLIPVEVLSEARVGDTCGVVAEHVNSRVDDAHRHLLPVRRQN